MSHTRKAEEKRRMKKLIGATRHPYARGVFELDGRYIRYYPYSSNHNRARYYRRHANRRVRRMYRNIGEDASMLTRGQYRKAYDLWWELY